MRDDAAWRKRNLPNGLTLEHRHQWRSDAEANRTFPGFEQRRRILALLDALDHTRATSPEGEASGGAIGFWDRLGLDDSLMPQHLPMGVTERGEGPENDSAAHHYVCWCGDTECPLTLALGHAWASGRRVTSPEVQS